MPKLTYEVYYADHFWWFRLCEVNHFGAPVEILFRRRFKSAREADKCGRQALEHTLALRRERSISQETPAQDEDFAE